MKNREQELIDLTFELAITAAKYMNDKNTEEIATWVAFNLRECGFDTEPMGMSWGVLKNKELNK